jgi:hypothetical protein
MSDPRLDFFSQEFDAGLALIAADLQPPDLTAPALDNMSKCRLLLPKEMPESLAGVKGKSGAEVRMSACLIA